MTVGLVVPAAGSGSRFGGAKQVQELCGEPILRHALRPFLELVDAIVVAASAALEEEIRAVLATLGPVATVVRGGDTRMASVAAGLAALPARCDRVLVHDAARPLPSGDLVRRCIAALDDAAAVVPAVPCSSTVKRVAGAAVLETVPRVDLVLAQTPQGFRREAGEAAFAQALREGWDCSDDVQVLERAGHAVRWIAGEDANIKITTRADLALAEALLRVGRAG